MRNLLSLRRLIYVSILICAGLTTNARTFYVSSSYTGTTSNGNFSTPWKSLSVLQSNLSSVMPGDTVAFKRGDFFSGTFTINRSGTALAPIVFTSYGTGDRPVFTGTGATITNLFYTFNRSYLVFDDLEVRDTTISATDRTVPAKIRNCFNFGGTSTYNVIKNCKISIVGVGAYFAPGADYNTIDSCEIGNLRMVVNTPTTVNNNDDYGANPVVISSTNNKVLHSYFHDCWANSYDYTYDGGAVEFYGSTGVNDNFIAYNTFYDCSGTVEFGSGNGGTMNNNVFAYNKFINNGKLFYINNSGAYTVNVTNLQFYNNVIVETVVNRLSSSNMGSMSVNVTTPGIVVLKNNVFQLSSGIDVVRANQWTGGQLIHEDNVYKLSNSSITNFTLSASEISTTANFWINTSGSNPLLWDYTPASSSLLIDLGLAVGQTVDINGNPINGLPDAGAIERQSVAPPVQPSPLVAAATSNVINCYGGTTTVSVSATGGTAPYTGTGSFTVSAGNYSYVVTDAVGARDTAFITINQPSIISVSVSSGTITIPGGTTTITVAATGGTGSTYTFSLDGSAYQTSNTFNNVASGNHTVNVKDANGCIMPKSFFINAPVVSPLVASISSGVILCNGGNATVTVSATGGVTPYSGTGSFTVVAGSYNYIVTDAAGTRDTVSITVSQPAILNLTLISGTIGSYGGTTSITCNASGGTGTKTYKLNSGNYQSSNIFNGVAAGVHTVTVRDANGCTMSASITITQPALPPLSVTAQAGAIACNGGSTNVVVSATGGMTPYNGTGSYSVVAGTYTYNVTDALGNVASTSLTVSQPAQLNLTLTSGNITGFGGTTTITATAVGGTGSYQFAINNGTYQTSNSFSGVSAGTHTVMVKDANNCTRSATISISQPGALNVSVTAGTIVCNGGTTTVNVTATGGVAPYTGIGAFTVNAGSYTYTVTDANGNTQNASISVAQPAAIAITTTTGVIAIMGGSTTVTVTATGGTPSFTYKLDNGNYQNSNIFNGVLAGSHIVTVKDNNGCTSTSNLNISQPSALLTCSAVASGNILCNGGTVNVSVTASGGTAPYSGVGVFSVAAGLSNFTVTDANGVTATTSINLIQPSAVAVSAIAGTITNFGGLTSVSASANGGTPGYTYSINGGAYQISGVFDNIAAGNHIINAKDNNGCIGSTAVSISQPTMSGIVVTATPGVITCFGGTTMVSVSATGGVPPYSGTGNFSAGAGTRTYTVRDAAGSIQSTTITINQPTEIQAVINVAGEVTTIGGTTTGSITASGGTPGYTYSLDGAMAQTSTTFRALTAGAHYVTVVDINGCAKVFTFNVTQAQSSSMILTLVSKSDVTCKGGSDGKIEVMASGGRSPYTYAIGTGIYGINNKFFNLRAGIYRVYAKDANNNIVNIVVSIADGKRRCSTGRFSDDPDSTNMNTSVTTPEFKLTAYPNPSTQAFNLKIEQQNHSDIQLDVLDINGRVIYTEKGTSTKLYRFGSDFKPGVYFVRVTQGKSVKTQKIIKL